MKLREVESIPKAVRCNKNTKLIEEFIRSGMSRAEVLLDDDVNVRNKQNWLYRTVKANYKDKIRCIIRDDRIYLEKV